MWRGRGQGDRRGRKVEKISWEEEKTEREMSLSPPRQKYPVCISLCQVSLQECY